MYLSEKGNLRQVFTCPVGLYNISTAKNSESPMLALLHVTLHNTTIEVLKHCLLPLLTLSVVVDTMQLVLITIL